MTEDTKRLRLIDGVLPLIDNDPEIQVATEEISGEDLESSNDAESNSHYSEDNDNLLESIATRCWLKAEACRWRLDRNSLLTLRVTFKDMIKPKDDALIQRAKIAGTFLWSNC